MKVLINPVRSGAEEVHYQYEFTQAGVIATINGVTQSHDFSDIDAQPVYEWDIERTLPWAAVQQAELVDGKLVLNLAGWYGPAPDRPYMYGIDEAVTAAYDAAYAAWEKQTQPLAIDDAEGQTVTNIEPSA